MEAFDSYNLKFSCFKRGLLLVSSFMLIYYYGQTQSINISPLFEKEDFEIQDFKADNLGNFYVINEDGTELLKLDDKGRLLFHFNEYKYGPISILDVSNPLKILVYCKDFQTILLLDNKLNLLHEISLDVFGFEYIEQIALTNDNLIWLYDPFEHLLIKFSDAQKQIRTTSNVLSEIGHVPQIKSLLERDNQLYVLEENGSVHIFNNYGRFINTLEINAKEIFPSNGQLFFQDQNGQFKNYDPLLRQEIPVILNGLNSIEYQLYMNSQYLMIYKERTMKVFTIN